MSAKSLCEATRGSSPLTRGKLGSEVAEGRRSGLIPAHAGKTGSRTTGARGSAAHPRSRGENRGDRFRVELRRGSSPLTRGKRYPARPSPRSWRLIPAHAGKTSKPLRKASTVRAHPRSRGENGVRHTMMWDGRGSSPLTRGKRSAQSGWRPWQRAHPRSRGENPTYMGALTVAPGSSPLTRGKPKAGLDLLLSGRLIPAHAGKTVRRGPPAGR